MSDTWTQERTSTCKKLWEDGLSASQIAAELGCTRNAVIGKVHRLKLTERQKAPPRLRKQGPARHHPFRATLVAATLEPEPEPIVDDNIIPRGQRKTLLQLTLDTCRWPVGDPLDHDFFYCGGSSYPGLPYCIYHSRVAYQPVERRDRRLTR